MRYPLAVTATPLGPLRVPDIEVLGGASAAAWQVSASMDVSLLRSGEQFGQGDLVELARWGHFSCQELPWEVPVRWLLLDGRSNMQHSE